MLIDEGRFGGATGDPSRDRLEDLAESATGNPPRARDAARRTVAASMLAATRGEAAVQLHLRLERVGSRRLTAGERQFLVDLRARLRSLSADRIALDFLHGRRVTGEHLRKPFIVVSDHISYDDCNSVGCIMGWAAHFFPERKHVLGDLAALHPILFSSGASGREGKEHALKRLDIVLGQEGQSC